MKAIKPHPLRIMAIVHGKSELDLCKSIRSNLRIKHKIIAHNNGASSIQISGILDEFRSYHFGSFKEFIKEYPDVEYKKGILQNFRLFIIMDVDDCDEQDKERYKNGQMFEAHWLHKYITPIFNDPNLERTMKQAGIQVKDKKIYQDLFQINHGALDVSTVEELMETMRQCPSTNLEEYLSYCLAIEKSQRNA
jgi:hypothetical protein